MNRRILDKLIITAFVLIGIALIGITFMIDNMRRDENISTAGCLRVTPAPADSHHYPSNQK